MSDVTQLCLRLNASSVWQVHRLLCRVGSQVVGLGQSRAAARRCGFTGAYHQGLLVAALAELCLCLNVLSVTQVQEALRCRSKGSGLGGSELVSPAL